MSFDIVFNSRSRPELLWTCLSAVKANSSDLSNIKAYIRLDNDDNIVLSQIDKFLEEFRFCHFSVGPRPTSLVESLNELAKLGQGKYIVTFGDDGVMQTPQWDIIAKELLDKYDDEIVYGNIKCNSVDKGGDKNYSSFPILSRRCFNILGYVIDTRVFALGGDVLLYRIFKEIGRVIEMPVFMDHTLHSSLDKVFNCDAVSQEMRRKSFAVSQDYFNMDISTDIAKLKPYLSENA